MICWALTFFLRLQFPPGHSVAKTCTSIRSHHRINKDILFSTTEDPPTTAPIKLCDIALCEFGTCVEIDGNATCQCNTICPAIYAPVCGTDDETYPSECNLLSNACERQEKITVLHQGECRKYCSQRILSGNNVNSIEQTQRITDNHYSIIK